MNLRIMLLLTNFVVVLYAHAVDECSILPAISEKQILVGWVTNERTTIQSTGETNLGAFRAVAIIEGGRIKEASKYSIKNGQKFWPIENANEQVSLISADWFLDQMGYDHCVYFASISEEKYPLWTLFTSKPDKRFRKPNRGETELFYKLNTKCVNQGDYPEGEEPPCTKPKLLAITDINNNNQLEYWATKPYLWDDGLTVWEYNGKELKILLDVCVGCSD